MCGVAGILSASGSIEPERIHKMAQAITHRGPDGYKTYQDNSFHCSHNLLKMHSNNTLPGPYISQNKKWILSFNGEIYNHIELKKYIESKAQIQWRHNTDAEILLEGWNLEGKVFLEKINGMFAFSLWNTATRVLYLACDQLAEKNLYYSIRNHEFIFSSEIKSFQAIHFPLQLNPEKIEEYFSYRYISGNETLFKNIRKLKPGEVLEISNELKMKSYFFKTDSNIDISDPNQYERTLQSFIESSIQLRTNSIYTNSIFLSSGLDSSLIATELPENSVAITLTQDKTADIKAIEKLCSRYRLNLVKADNTYNLSNLLDECIIATEEPIGDSIQISNMILAKEAKKNNLRLTMTGDGADEVFAGYIHHLAISILQDIKLKIGLKGLLVLSKTLPLLPSLLISYITPYSQNLSFETKKRLILILKSYLRSESPLPHMTQIFKTNSLNSEIYQSEKNIFKLDEILSHDIKHWLPNYVLLRNDKILMSQSIEGRHPYLDPRILELSKRLPIKYLIKGLERKYILKIASLKYLNEKTAFQKKQSFVIDYDLNKLLNETDFKSSITIEYLKKENISVSKPEFIDRKKLFLIIAFQRWLNLFNLN